MNLTPEQLYILLMEQTLDNARLHEARCRRRFHAAEDDLIAAAKAVTALHNQIEGRRQEMLKRGCV